MNNEQKNEYIKPEMTIIEMVHDASLLEESCVGEECNIGTCWDNGDGCDDDSGEQLVMKKKYSIPEVEIIRLKVDVVLLQPSIASGAVGMIPDAPTTSSHKDVGQ